MKVSRSRSRVKGEHFNAKGQRVCGSPRKSDGKPCQNPPASPNGRCRMHGATTPRGPASPHFKHGRYCDVLPLDLAKRYLSAKMDPDLAQLMDEIALIDARIASVLSDLSGTAGSGLWRQAAATLAAFQEAGRAKNADAARGHLDMLTQVLERGLSEAVVWDQVLRFIETRMRLVSAETRRRKDLHQMLTIERAMVLYAALTDAVQRHVSDPKQLTAITAEFVRITEAGDRPPALPGRVGRVVDPGAPDDHHGT